MTVFWRNLLNKFKKWCIIPASMDGVLRGECANVGSLLAWVACYACSVGRVGGAFV